jgi:hypothetical protein
MKMFDHLLLPVGALLLAAAGAVLADRAALLRRRPHGERGDYWTGVVLRVCVLLAFPVFLSGLIAIFPDAWQTGRHLQFDLTGAFGWSLPFCYRVALLIPFAVWAALLIFGLAEKPRDREAGRWLAGAIGFGDSRAWILLCAIPLALILAATLSDLGGGPGAYPGAVWATLAVLMLSLIGVALSAGQPIPVTAPSGAPAESEERQLAPWPQALESHGLRLRHVVSWPRSRTWRPVRPGVAQHLMDRLRARGANGVAPQMIEAVDDLMSSDGTNDGHSRVVFGPDGCGQAEAVALAAEMLEQRFHSTTLVVTPGDGRALAAELARWLPPGTKVTVVEPGGDPDADALVVIVDAQTLSDRFLPQLKNPLLLKRFGLIVWWHLEAYTGVLAANLWAISRRLHRLLQAMGRHDARTLIFMRSTPHGSGQPAAFVRRLLPHPLPPGLNIEIAPQFARDVHLHVLESHHAFFAAGEGRNILERHRHLPLVAAKVSVEEGWPTLLEVPTDISEAEAEAMLQLPAGEVELRSRLEYDSASAGARVRKIEAGDVLSLVETVSQGGRSANDGLPHHIGVILPPNPYVGHLLSTLAGDSGFRTSRRLVSAAAQTSVVRRHLLLALDELPDTRSGLLKNFLWNDKVIEATLNEISDEGKLTRKEVRFLDEHGELRREYEYKSQRPPAGERRPLDTVGAELVDVRDRAAGFERQEGVRMRVDPERLTIQAYPHRVFLSGGLRYRIREWRSIERAVDDGGLECVREDIYSLTWRIRNASVYGIEAADAPVGIGSRGKLLARMTASLHYEEEVTGALRLIPDLTTGAMPKPEKLSLAEPITQGFRTRGLILRFPQKEEPGALASLAQALRHVLPVHLGGEEDALEVVPLTGQIVQERAAYGLAIVDLYPGGIGLIDAVADDNNFLLELFGWAQEWLAACPCQNEQGCEHCLRSPSALAANINRPPSRTAALDLLRQVV